MCYTYRIMQVKVYAKLNLTLNVLGTQNGFHNIDSLVTSVDIFDVVNVVPCDDKRVTVSGLDNVSITQNTAYKAACAFIERFSVFDSNLSAEKPSPLGVRITLQKGIPMGAGMGGSSADAAAVIYAMCKLYGVDVNSNEIHALCAELGSDINYMLHGGLAILNGKGDDIKYYNLGSPLYFALTTFDTSMSTADVYSQFDKLNAEQVYVDNNALAEVLQNGRVMGVSECFNNHLQAATVSLSDYASNYLQFCGRCGLRFNMTGSGSAYYVACDSLQSANKTAELLNAQGFATTVCHSVPQGIDLMKNA